MMKSAKIRVGILDDHQSIIDGIVFRLADAEDIEVVFTATFGEEVESNLAHQAVDVLLIDVGVPTAPDNHNPYPILQSIPVLLETHPALNILAISMFSQRSLIKAVIDAGASGYILKEDQATIRELPHVVRTVAKGGIYFSQQAHQQLLKELPSGPVLTPRQTEALSLCAAHPEATTSILARELGISNSTFRNLLSGAYLRLGVGNRAAAIAEARRLGMITPSAPSLDLNSLE